jgi:hypothetical protein
MKMREMRVLTAGLVLMAPLAVAAPVQAAAQAACARVAGDFNGDGHADIAATAPFTEDADDAAGAAGAVAIAYGPGGSGGNQWIAARSLGGASIREVVASGYFDDDCYADLAVGGYSTVVVVSGSPSGLVPESTAVHRPADVAGGEGHSYFGRSVATGDFNGDGRDDLAVGAPGRSIEQQGGEPQPEDDGGAIAVFPGSAGGLTAAGSRWLTEATMRPYSLLGVTLAAGDFDGDGTDDLAAGAPESESMAGEVVVFRGAGAGIGTAGSVLLDQDSPGVPGTAEDYDFFGSTLAAGDLTGDGRADLVVGSPGEGIGAQRAAGSVAVLKGGAGGVTGAGSLGFDQDTAQIPGTAESGDLFGEALAIGDLTGDGRADLVVGSPGEDVGATVDTGAVTAIAGTATGPSAAGARYLDQNSAGIPGSNESGDAFGAAVRSIPGALVVAAPTEVTGSDPSSFTGAFTVVTGDLSAGSFFGPAQFPGVQPGRHDLGTGLG